VALLSYYAEGLNMKAVGERLGVSRQRAVQLVEDAKLRLRKMMQDGAQ
jgi:DNA-directed RNA polymerase specialized sigma subunit